MLTNQFFIEIYQHIMTFLNCKYFKEFIIVDKVNFIFQNVELLIVLELIN
jgi:hypothetical protein